MLGLAIAVVGTACVTQKLKTDLGGGLSFVFHKIILLCP
jgi:hypothetical protein